MGAREDVLTSDLEQARAAVADDLVALKREAAQLQRKVGRVAAVVVGAYVAYRVVRFLVRRKKGD